jgi:hypothetical protein
MALFTLGELQGRARTKIARYSKVAAKANLDREIKGYSDEDRFDIFLSHRLIDYDSLLVLKDRIEDDYRFTLYVDHVQDPFLDREKVQKETAILLRKRMGQCRCLLFATTSSSSESKWMPWELGYFDGLGRRVAILPVIEAGDASQNTYRGQEYLGIYPYITKDPGKAKREHLWATTSETTYCRLDLWIGGRPIEEHSKG